MSTSGTITFNNTRNQIIQNALTLIAVAGAEDTISNADISFANQILNMMIKSWEAEGIGEWCTNEGTLLLQDDVAIYNLGGSSSSKASDTVVETNTSAAAISGATTVVVDSVTGMTIGDHIGIVQDDNTIKWTTISLISTLTLTIGSALTAAAASGNKIYVYTTVVNKPLRVTQIRFRDSNGFDRPLTRLMREDYMNLSDKSTQGDPTQWFLDMQLNTATLYLYPVPNSVSTQIKYTYTRSLEDLTGANENPDIPSQFLSALTYNLAVMLAPAYGKLDIVQKGLGQIAGNELSTCKGFDIEDGSIYIVPEIRK